MEDDNFTYDRFSTELITECILQHLETNVPQRHYATNVPMSEGLRKWIKLTETLISCIRIDLRVGKKDTIVKSPIDRKTSAKTICKWYTDLKTLKTLYIGTFYQKCKDDRLQKEVDILFNYLDYICDLAEYLNTREVTDAEFDDNHSKEVVFIFDDAQSTGTRR